MLPLELCLRQCLPLLSVGLQTDVEGLGKFYEEVLGFTRTDKGSMPGPGGAPIELVFLSRNPEEHHQVRRNTALSSLVLPLEFCFH
eukprot:SAG22_NODE_958_length_6301_cov_4.995324_2_plen_86_part_00